jgi:hypothetical protein
MTAPSKMSLAERVFRAGTAFDLIVYDRLPQDEQAALAELTTDPDFYGILRPQQPNGQTVKSVNRDTALLWLTLRSPGPLPFFVLTQQPEVASSESAACSTACSRPKRAAVCPASKPPNY